MTFNFNQHIFLTLIDLLTQAFLQSSPNDKPTEVREVFMPTIPVIGYALLWKTKQHAGGVRLKLQNNQVVDVPTTPDQFAAMAAILNESPVFYRTEDGFLSTEWEPVGGTG